MQSVEKILLSVISMLGKSQSRVTRASLLFKHYYLSCVSAYSNVSPSNKTILPSAEPNPESGANVDACKMWRDNREQFLVEADKAVRRTLGL